MSLGGLAAAHDLRVVLVALCACVASGVMAARLYAQGRRESRFFRNLWIAATGMLVGTGAWATHLLALMAYQPDYGAHYHVVLAAGGWVVAILGAWIAVAVGIRQREHQARLAAGAVLGVALCAMEVMGFASLQPHGPMHWSGEFIALWGTLGIFLAMASVWALGLQDRWWVRAVPAVLLTLALTALHLGGVTAMSQTPGPAPQVTDLAIATPILATIVIFLMLASSAVAMGAVAVSAKSQVQALGDLREAIDAMPAGLAFYDAEDRCIIWNSGYAALGGEAGRHLRVGATFRDLIQAQLDGGALADGIGREAEYLEERLALRRDSLGPVEQLNGDRCLRVEDRRTSSGGTVSILHDITDLKQAAQALEAARNQAEQANRAKSEFLANMSHELRTPLNGVIGVAHALARTRLTARQRDMLQTVQSSALTLQGVLADLLDLARIESGKLELAPTRFRMGEVLRDVASLWRLEAEKKGVRFEVDIAPDAEAEVECDQVRLRQVVVNLLSNAVKFTSTGTVRLQADRDPCDPDKLRLRVSDSGIGFTPDAAERLFARFEQADGSVTRRFGGTGLGLAISRDLVERMGGSIRASGELGQGAVFQVEIPLPALAAEISAEPEAAAEAPAQLRPLRVLCAEDHPVNRKVVEFILGSAGVDLVCAGDGREALELFATQSFDAILMDMQMPVMDGLSATREIRRREATGGLAPTPVIMVTANAMPEHIAQSLAAGADRHLTKPIAADRMLSLLDEVTRDGFECAAAEAEAA